MASEWRLPISYVVASARDQSLPLIHDLAVMAGQAGIAREALSEMAARVGRRGDADALELPLEPITREVRKVRVPA